MNTIRYFSLAFLSVTFLFLSGCNSTVSTLKTDDEVLSDGDLNMGYLLIGVETNFSLKEIDIDGPQDISLSHHDLRAGNNFILVPLESGIYEIERVHMTNYARYRLREEDNWKFQIRPQTISYVGHLEFQSRGYFSSFASIELVNRSTEAIEFMQQDFPSILDNRDMYYGGPGEDDFFNFIEQLGK